MTLDRRTVLRGAGVCLSLPFLEAMGAETRDAGQGASATCKRIATLSVPFGVVMDKFHPTTTGIDYDMAPSMQPMA